MHAANVRHVYSREEASWETPLGGQGGSTATGVREPVTVTAAEGEATAAEAWRTGRADLRALLRDRRHATNPSAKTQQHSQTAAHPCCRNESGLLLRNLYGSGTPRSLQGLSFTLRFLAGMVAYTLDSEKPQLFGARVTYQHFVPPYYHPRTCARFHRSEIQKRTLTPDC